MIRNRKVLGGEKKRLEKLIEKVSNRYNFVIEKRVSEKIGMITIIHPLESDLEIFTN
ncbi:MAG: hypothetical protein HGN29_01725 [Asgard group archaeon]|nr:hypothetical protein [Asgard group archaeon]